LTELPEYYGFYALESGRLIDLAKPGAVRLSSKATFLLFDKNVGLITGFGAVRLSQYGAVCYRDRNPEELYAPVTLMSRPVKGQPELVQFVPSRPLRPGFYRLDDPVNKFVAVDLETYKTATIASSLRVTLSEKEATLAFDISGGVPPHRFEVNLNDQPLETVLLRYRCTAQYDTTDRHAGTDQLYAVGSPKVTASEAGTINCSLAFRTNERCPWPFAWPADLPFPIRLQVVVQDDSQPPRTQKLEQAITSGPHEFAPLVETDQLWGRIAKWVETDGKARTPLDVAGSWILRGEHYDDRTRDYQPFKENIMLQQVGSDFTGSISPDRNQDAVTIKGRLMGYAVRFDIYARAEQTSSWWGIFDPKSGAASGGWKDKWGRYSKWSMNRVQR